MRITEMVIKTARSYTRVGLEVRQQAGEVWHPADNEAQTGGREVANEHLSRRRLTKEGLENR